jgi:hypothetical protein
VAQARFALLPLALLTFAFFLAPLPAAADLTITSDAPTEPGEIDGLEVNVHLSLPCEEALAMAGASGSRITLAAGTTDPLVVTGPDQVAVAPASCTLQAWSADVTYTFSVQGGSLVPGLVPLETILTATPVNSAASDVPVATHRFDLTEPANVSILLADEQENWTSVTGESGATDAAGGAAGGNESFALQVLVRGNVAVNLSVAVESVSGSLSSGEEAGPYGDLSPAGAIGTTSGGPEEAWILSFDYTPAEGAAGSGGKGEALEGVDRFRILVSARLATGVEVANASFEKDVAFMPAAADDDGGGKESPAVAPVVLLLALAAVVVVRRPRE